MAGNEGDKNVWISGFLWVLKQNEIIIIQSLRKDEKFAFHLDFGGIWFRLVGRLLPSWFLLFNLSRLLSRIFFLLATGCLLLGHLDILFLFTLLWWTSVRLFFRFLDNL